MSKFRTLNEMIYWCNIKKRDFYLYRETIGAEHKTSHRIRKAVASVFETSV